MSSLPEPMWPVIALAVIQFGDALLCIKPARFIAQCFEDVGFPRRYWWMMTPLKLAAAAGLIAGLWLPYLGALTCVALVAYFMIAVAMHVRSRDFGRTLFVNATGMLILCIGTGAFSFVLA